METTTESICARADSLELRITLANDTADAASTNVLCQLKGRRGEQSGGAKPESLKNNKALSNAEDTANIFATPNSSKPAWGDGSPNGQSNESMLLQFPREVKQVVLALALRIARSGKHPGRQELPANLPRIERVLLCTPYQRACKCCGKETVVIGYEESSQLDVEPVKYFVLVTKREKRACRWCEELGVVSAPLPLRIIDRCLASDRIVIDTVVSKYCNHTPLHRQSVILERDLGLEISRATLDGWVLTVGELLIPMVAAMRLELIRGTYIQADEKSRCRQTQGDLAHAPRSGPLGNSEVHQVVQRL